MKQTKDELERWHATKDAWGYETNPDDQYRKEVILAVVEKYKPYKRALDIGAGEGWITKDLPARKIEAIELSDNAANRFPDNVIRVYEPKGTYDLVIATGVFYEQYDYKQFYNWIIESATNIVLTCNIASWERDIQKLHKHFACVYETVFDYRGYKEHLCLFKKV